MLLYIPIWEYVKRAFSGRDVETVQDVSTEGRKDVLTVAWVLQSEPTGADRQRQARPGGNK
jgi:hypothetical protein